MLQDVHCILLIHCYNPIKNQVVLDVFLLKHAVFCLCSKGKLQPTHCRGGTAQDL